MPCDCPTPTNERTTELRWYAHACPPVPPEVPAIVAALPYGERYLLILQQAQRCTTCGAIEWKPVEISPP